MKKIATLFSIGFLSLACNQVIDVDLPPHEPRVVLNSFLIAGDSLNFNTGNLTISFQNVIQLSQSVGAFEPNQNVLNQNSQVRILENGQLIYQEGSSTGPPWARAYFSFGNVAIASGNTYEVQASIDDLPGPAIGRQTIPENAQILASEVVSSTGNQVRVRIRIQDPPGPNRYLIRVNEVGFASGNEQFYNRIFFNCLDPSFAPLDLFEDLDFDDFEIGAFQGLIKDETFDGQVRDFEFRLNTWDPGMDSVRYDFEWYSITADFEKYLRSYYRNVRSNSNPFAEPASIFMNVDNGYGTVLGAHRWVISVSE
jgi:hypothetical protein